MYPQRLGNAAKEVSISIPAFWKSLAWAVWSAAPAELRLSQINQWFRATFGKGALG